MAWYWFVLVQLGCLVFGTITCLAVLTIGYESEELKRSMYGPDTVPVVRLQTDLSRADIKAVAAALETEQA
jgi:hypothetical protein